MLMTAEEYEKHKDEMERPHAPKNYLDKVLVGRVHWISPNGLGIDAQFWEADNEGVTDGHPEGYLGDAWIETEVRTNYKIGDKILGKVSPAVTMVRMFQEFSWRLLHMTREQRADFSKDWTEERRLAWEQHLDEERKRWQIGLE